MKMRSWMVIVAAGVLAVALAGCSNPATNTSPSSGSKGSTLPASCKTKKPTIGVALPNTVNPYYVAMQKSFKDNGKALGFDVKVAIANDSDSAQLSQVQAFIQQKVCAIALNGVNSGPAVASVVAANKAGIPVFTVNVSLDEKSMKAQNAKIVQYVGPNQAAGGKLMGEQALKDLGADAKIVAGIVGDPDQLPTNQRDQGFKDAWSKDANAKVVATVNSKVDPNVSLKVTGDMLQGNPEINLIFADTGPGAVGALQAVKQAGKEGSVNVYAFCAASTPVAGNYKACVAQEPAEYAKIVLTNLKKYIGGASVDPTAVGPFKVFVTGQTPGPGEVG